MTNLLYLAKRGSHEDFVAAYDPTRANERDSTGSTVLHAALANTPVVRALIAGRLLDDGADAAAVTRDGATTAHVLLGRPRLDVATDAPLLQRLFDGGCDPNRVHGRFGTPLLTLARQLKFPDDALGPLYDVLVSAPGFDPLAPAPPDRSTYESVRLLGDRRAELARRIAPMLGDPGDPGGGDRGGTGDPGAPGDRPGGRPTVDADPTGARIDRERALDIAREALVELEQELTVPLAFWEGDPAVEPITDHGDVWVVMWNSVEYLRTRDFHRQQLVGPIVIPKDGRPWFNPPTARPVEVELDLWRRGTRHGEHF